MLGYVSSSSSGNQILDVLQCLKMVRWESVHLKVFVSQEILLKIKEVDFQCASYAELC